MNTTSRDNRSNRLGGTTLTEQRAEIRHLIELQPEYFQRDIVVMEQPAPKQKGLAAIIPFPLSSWRLRSV